MRVLTAAGLKFVPLPVFAIGEQPEHTILNNNNAKDIVLPAELVREGGVFRICARGNDVYLLVREPGDNTSQASSTRGLLLPNESAEYLLLTPGQTISAIRAGGNQNIHICIAACKSI